MFSCKLVADEMDSDTFADFERTKPDIGEPASQPSSISNEDFAAAFPITSDESDSVEKQAIEPGMEESSNLGDSVATFAQTTDVASVSDNATEEEMDEPRRREKVEREGLEVCRKMYSREEMEALRFENMGEQKKVWKTVCKGLDVVVRKEYDVVVRMEESSNLGDSVATFAQTTDVASVSDNATEEEMDEPRRREKVEREGLEVCRKMYSREEMEALRFENMGEQKKVWKTVCKGLDVVVRKEYDGLTSSKRNRHRPAKNGESSETLEMVKIEKTIDDASALDVACTYRAGDEEDFPALEGEHIEDDDSDEEYHIQRPAFLVEGEPNFDSGPPEDGLEYLRRVRWEAAKIPKFRVAKLDKSKLNKEQSDYMPKIPEIAKCQEHLLPSKQWEDAFLGEFSQLRTVISRLQITSVNGSEGHLAPFKQTEENYSCQFFDGITRHDFEEIATKIESDHSHHQTCPENEHEQLSHLYTDQEDNNISLSPDKSIPKSSANEGCRNYPLLSLMLKMDSVARVSMLKKKISSFCGMDSLQRNECLWLFALCAVIDTPLDADTCASLRDLLRKSANLRAHKSVLDDEVVMMNILITISGRYFGQLES